MKAVRRSVQKGFTIQANWKYGPRIPAWEELWRQILRDVVNKGNPGVELPDTVIPDRGESDVEISGDSTRGSLA
jgi:hypothetical protein